MQAFNFLYEKFESKLQAWKGRLLSLAGRLVLIRSVLMSILIYFMATTKTPKKVINGITGTIRRFFWGKPEKERYMAYIAWKKILCPIEGGLGLRCLDTINDALLTKFLWRLASDSSSLWATQIRAKYLPRSKLWHSKRTSTCTVF